MPWTGRARHPAPLGTRVSRADFGRNPVDDIPRRAAGLAARPDSPWSRTWSSIRPALALRSRFFHRHDNGRGRNDDRDDRRDERYDNRHDERRDNRGYSRWDGHPGYYGARGPDFRRGGYLPYEYRRPIYVVNNYYGHHLPAPRRGHQWVQVGADYVLIAIATGVIAQIILSQ